MKQIKHYKKLEKLGSGGMGEIYKAFDSILERDVAIKVMHPHLVDDDACDARFMREARSIAQTQHPNVVSIYEIGKSKAGRYIVMELVKGVSLNTLIKTDGPLKPKRAVNLIRQILSGLQHLHNLGLVHRDIKSDNILISDQDHVKILDFGIAKTLSQSGVTMAGEILGTIEYVAPEQLLNETIDCRCDVYAAGMILYQMLTNQLPFNGNTPAAMLYQKLNDDPSAPSFHNKEVGKHLDQIVLQAIQQDREDRWQNAEAFENALDTVPRKEIDPLGNFESDDLQSLLETDEDTETADALNAGIIRPTFIGRDAEFRTLLKIYHRTTKNQGETVILEGEAGVGKSTLATRFNKYVQKNGAKVLYGACLYQEGMDPYLPFIDALRQFFSKQSFTLPEPERLQLKEMVRESVPILLEFTERFTTSFGTKPVPTESQSPPKETNLFEGIQMILDFLASTRPIVVVIDDLQWADEASLHLFHYLSRRVTGNRILLLGISRTDRFDLHKDGKPGIVVDILARMRREGLCKDIKLNRLCRESCDALIDKSLVPNLFTPEFYSDIYTETKGNPLFVTETLKLLIEKKVIYCKEEIWYNKEDQLELTTVPDRVEDIFIRRLSSLTPEEYEILQIAAVQGYRFDASLISKVMEISKIDLLKTLQRIERNSEVIVSNDRGFQFEHPILADIIYKDIPGVLSREYHLMMAAVLENMYSPDFGALVGDIAQHYRRGGNHDRAIPLLYQAGLRTFGLSAYSESCLYFEYLLDSLACSGQTIPETVSESDLYLKLGKCYEEGGRWEEGLDAYNKLYAISKQTTNAEGQSNALVRMGRLYGKLGDWKLAIAKYEECLNIAKQHDMAGVLCKIYNNLGIIYLQKGEFDQALQHFNDTLATVDSEPGDIFKAHALTNIGIIANIRHEHQTAMDNYKKALAIYSRKDTCQQDQARIYHNLGMTLADVGEWQEASEALEDCVKFATEVQDKQLLAMAYLNMGKTLVRQNKLAAAKKYTEKAVKVFKRMDDMLNVAEAYHVFGLIHSAQSQYSEALKFINDSIHINRELGYQEGLAEAYLAHGKVNQEAGELSQARMSYEQALEVYQGLNIHSKAEEIITVIDGLEQPSETEVQVETSRRK